MEGLEIEAASKSAPAALPAWPSPAPSEVSLGPSTPRGNSGFLAEASCSSSSEAGSNSSQGASAQHSMSGQTAFLEALVQTDQPTFITVNLLLHLCC